MTRIATAARSAVLEDQGAEPFDVWATVPEWADLRVMPACAFVPEPRPEDHLWMDTVRQWMECVGCGRVDIRDDFLP